MSPEKLGAGKDGKRDQNVLEKAGTEELPPGWTKDVKSRKSGSRTKKDAYYKDPVTGCIFRSLKDVQRYLKTGEVGKLAIKPKDNISEEIEGKENASSRDVKLLETCGLEEREDKSESKETMIVPTPSSGSSRCKQPLDNGSEGHTKRNKCSEKSKSALPQRASKRLAGIDCGDEKSKTAVPRRASKRLAGVDVDVPLPSPLPEPKTRRQGSAKRARQAETSTAVDLGAPKERDVKVSRSHGKKVNPIALSEGGISTPEEHAWEVEKINKPIDKQEILIISPPASEHDKNADTDNKPIEKQEIHIILPPANLPAIKVGCQKVKEEDVKAADEKKHKLLVVLPPVTPSTPKEHDKEIRMDDRSKEKQVLTPPEEHNSSAKTDNSSSDANQVLPNPIVATSVNMGIEEDNKVPVSLPCPEDSYEGVKDDIKPGSSVDFSLNDLWTDPCIEFAVKTLTGAIPIGNSNKVDNFPTTSQLELPLEELWTDPCIEFAVKTLTGAIPVEQDLCAPHYLQNQPTNSSQTPGETSFSLPDICVNNFCQTEVLSKHYEMAEYSLHNKQQDMAATPTMPPTHRSNGSLQNLGNSVLPQEAKQNSGQCSKPRFFQ